MMIKKTILLFLFSLFFFIKLIHAQYIIELGNKKIPQNLKDSYVHEIEVSDRVLGKIWVNNTQTQDLMLGRTTLENSLKKYFLQYGKIGTPLKLKITSLELIERKARNEVQGEVRFAYEAYVLKNGNAEKICQAKSGIRYTRSQGLLEPIRGQIESVLDAGMKFLIDFIQKNHGVLESFATKSTMEILPFRIRGGSDTLFYQNKKISWDDFRGSVQPSSYGAAIYSSFGYGLEATVQNRILKFRLQPYVFMDKSFSWVKNNSRTEAGLRHEQIHFDISYLACLDFIQKVKNIQFDNYDDQISAIKYEYLEAYKRLTAMQKKYDNETEHSIRQTEQQKWEREIGERLN